MSGRPCLPCRRRLRRTAGPLRSAGITPPHRYSGPVRHPLVVGRFPGCTGYTAYPAPPISRRDEEGFSSCLTCPGHRAVAPTPPEGSRRVSQTATVPAAFTREAHVRPPGLEFSGPPLRSLTLRPGNSLPILPMGLSMGFRASVSLRPAIQATGPLALAPVGLPPTEHVCLSGRTSLLPAALTANSSCGAVYATTSSERPAASSHLRSRRTEGPPTTVMAL